MKITILILSIILLLIGLFVLNARTSIQSLLKLTDRQPIKNTAYLFFFFSILGLVISFIDNDLLLVIWLVTVCLMIALLSFKIAKRL